MKTIIQLFLSFTLLTTIFSSCSKDEAPAIDMGYGYFPNTPGKYVVYDVDSIVMNSFTKTVDTFKFQLKEIIESVYTDNSGRPALRLERYRKNYSKTIPYNQMTWTLTDVWSENRTPTTAEKVEENIRFVRLVFPVAQNKKWNGNVYNSIGEWDYTYTEIDKAKTITGITFDSTLTVLQNNQENLIDKQYYQEMYA